MTEELDQITRMRILVAAQVAAGLASDGDWRSNDQWAKHAADTALSVADEIIAKATAPK